MDRSRFSSLVLLAVALLANGCADNRKTVARNEVRDATAMRPVSQSFGQAGDGTVIPDAKPDPEALAFAQRCSGRGGSAVAMGMSECALIGAKGTPSRVVGGEDQAGRSHDAIWYIEGGVRTVYKFDDDKLVAIVR